jgi:phospholipase C
MARGLGFGVYRQHPVHFMMTVMNPEMSTYPNLPIENFFEHAAQGTLPNITIVEPHYGFNDDHPPHDVRLGQAFIAGVYEAMRQSPQWDRCLMVVLYDEHGGFYDHVAPPKAAGEERAAEGFDQLGFRVPGLVVGPLVRPGSVFSEVVDHASVPALISRVFGLEHVNDRSRLAGDFANALDIERTLDANRSTPPALPQIELPTNKIRHAAGLPFGQPELAELARRRFGIEVGGFDESMRGAERWLRAMESLRVARVI